MLAGAIALAAQTAACDGRKPDTRSGTPVLTQTAQAASRTTTVSLTGEIRARVQSDLAFRFAGRIATRSVEVGDHVTAGQILATLETNEQTADVSAARAGVQAAEATLNQVAAVFERQQTLMQNGFTTQTTFDNAKQSMLAAQATLETAKANLATAEDQLANTTLRADASGVVTQRNAEVGQVVEAAQAVYTVARDGERDAVFEVYESLLATPPSDKRVEIRLLSDPSITAVGVVREIAPTIDPASGAVRVKLAVQNPPPEMSLGAPVAGIGHFRGREVFTLPWTALFSKDGKSAVWVVDPTTKLADLRVVTVDSYGTGRVSVREGLKPGETVVTAGGQLLRPGQLVEPRTDAPVHPAEAQK